MFFVVLLLILNSNEIKSTQLNLRPSSDSDDAIRLARGKVGAEDLCKGKTCVEERQCYLAGKCIKSTGECSISTYTEKEGSSCDDGNRRTTNDVCKNGDCIGVSVNVRRKNFYKRCFQKCPKHATCRSRTYHRKEWTGKRIEYVPYTASACSCAPGYYGSTRGADGVSGKGWNRGGHGSIWNWPSFSGKCYECALGEYSDYWSNSCKKCSPGTYTEVTRTANKCVDCWPGRYAPAKGASGTFSFSFTLSPSLDHRLEHTHQHSLSRVRCWKIVSKSRYVMFMSTCRNMYGS